MAEGTEITAQLIPGAVQQHSRNLPPFVVRRIFRVGLVRAFIPIACVLFVPFLAVEIGMNPSPFLSRFLFLGDLVSAVKISLGIPPQSLEQGRQARRGRALVERSA
jgi:hypothetical protein